MTCARLARSTKHCKSIYLAKTLNSRSELASSHVLQTILDDVTQAQHTQVLQKAQDWLADNDALNLLEMLLWSGYEDVREQ